MGCGTSQQRGLGEQASGQAGSGTGTLVHPSWKSYKDVPVIQMYRRIEDKVISNVQAMRKNRTEATKRLYEARGAQGLQAKGLLMSIYATPEEVFRDYLTDSPEYVNMPTLSSSPFNAIAGSTMLFQATEAQQLVESSGVAPNTPLLGGPLAHLLRLKALWGSRLLSMTLLITEHPALGKVVLVQPLLLAACMQRIWNWGKQVDPVFEVLLQAGADPNARNSLNMTPLMLVATALINELEYHTERYQHGSAGAGGSGGGGGGDDDGGLRGVVAGKEAAAAATVRLLLEAGADPAAEMRGFGAGTCSAEQWLRRLPSSLRSSRHVLHLDRYTAHDGFQLMRSALMSKLPGPIPDDPLDEFAELLRPTGRDSARVAPSDVSSSGSGGDNMDPVGALRPAADGVGVAPVKSGEEAQTQPGGSDEGARDNMAGAHTGEGADQGSSTTVKATEQQQQQQQQEDGTPQGEQPIVQGWRLQVPSRPSVQHLTWPWTQAMSNIAWAVSQLAMVSGARARRTFLSSRLRQLAPFYLPDMSVVSVEQLRRLGCIPRYSLDGAPASNVNPEPGPGPGAGPGQASAPEPPPAGSGFQPTPASSLPDNAVVVFVSHRWLGRGCPDDEHGTKLKQVLAIADHVSAQRRVPLSSVFLWLDYSVVDQSNPMPGVQALPIYIACCEEFVYVEHGEYWQRAWCLTEQYMHWKLAAAETKRVLQPASLTISEESARERPPDPTFGKLAVEADRVALATMTAIMPYDIDD